MLVLSRKPGEGIRIGDQVVVTVVRVGPNNVRIGIKAPDSVNIVRDELLISESQDRREGSQVVSTLV